ncbi:hypothetical protein KIK06_07360 [Nocardiopsis sp. EMB25]|uniref:hypothetical protein n=1 Tax=Nocardiopsis sp. EMB25 TaxID=2835867 RepID=UPI002284149C|nr:hypothetical protein [Nocardiopsis sp. EMB25]MCY9783708.1 hypothetical protein [Nocardiopsis sp. EMB25]
MKTSPSPSPFGFWLFTGLFLVGLAALSRGTVAAHLGFGVFAAPRGGRPDLAGTEGAADGPWGAVRSRGVTAETRS